MNKDRILKVGITGGIGGGKSIVSKLFSALGAPVYDSDSRAKALMSSDDAIKKHIIALFGEQSYIDTELNRAHISQMAFADQSLLEKLNSVVHPAVERDFTLWAREQSDCPYVILESAILIESGFCKLVDKVICISAPVDVRIARTIARDNIPEVAVRKRIESQMQDAQRAQFCNYTIENDGENLILPQVVELDKIFRNDEGR